MEGRDMELDGITVWDGHGELGPCRVRWDQGRIEEVLPGRQDAHAGVSLVPGLVDTHVHLVNSAADRPVTPDVRRAWSAITPEPEQILHGVANALRAARGGVTTMVDKAADERQLAIGRAFEERLMPGPRVYTNCAVGMTAGHFDLFTPPAVQHRRNLADGVDECRRLVRTWARAGSLAIKLATSGGVLSVGDANEWRNYTADEVAAVVDESHALGMAVAAHAHTEAGIQTAIDHGVDAIEHATCITDAQVDEVVRRGITIGPTLIILDKIANGSMPVLAEQRAKAQALHARRGEVLRAARSSGVIFRLATDSAGARLASEPMEEVRAMCSGIGYSAEESLRAATSVAAASMRIDEVAGEIRPGRGADFLLLRGEPWKDIDCLRPENIVAVVCRGTVLHGELPN